MISGVINDQRKYCNPTNVIKFVVYSKQQGRILDDVGAVLFIDIFRLNAHSEILLRTHFGVRI